jgi:hypothetical protein
MRQGELIMEKGSFAWDKTIAPGDIVTGYHAGYWCVTKVVRRYVTKEDKKRYPDAYGDSKVGDEYAPEVYYVRLLDQKLKPVRNPGNEKCCDASYCTKWDKGKIEAWYRDEVQTLDLAKQFLLGVLAKNEQKRD